METPDKHRRAASDMEEESDQERQTKQARQAKDGDPDDLAGNLKDDSNPHSSDKEARPGDSNGMRASNIGNVRSRSRSRRSSSRSRRMRRSRSRSRSGSRSGSRSSSNNKSSSATGHVEVQPI